MIDLELLRYEPALRLKCGRQKAGWEMANLDLISDEGLRDACTYVEQTYRESAKNWTKELADFLGWAASADESTRASLNFQKRLWDENPVSSVGQGNIAVAKALADGDFRRWLA